MHLHGSAGLGEPAADDPQLIDLDALLTEQTQTPSPQADVA